LEVVIYIFYLSTKKQKSTTCQIGAEYVLRASG
jgi:hypothetical protein